MEILLFFVTRRFMMEGTGALRLRTGNSRSYIFNGRNKSEIGNESNTLNPFETFIIVMNQSL
jgi:hypothetical protein